MKSGGPILSLCFVLCAAAALAGQYRAIPAPGIAFAPIANASGAVQIANCDDCTSTVTLSFTFPWFATSITSIEVSSNGSIFLDGSTTAFFEARTLQTATPARISVAQEDLDPRPVGGVWVLDRGTSLVVSYEGVPFFTSFTTPPNGSVNAQIEIFASGAIELRYGMMDTANNQIVAGLSAPEGRTSPNAVLPEFGQNTGRTAPGVAPQQTVVQFFPIALTFQTNSPEASLDLDGIQGTPLVRALKVACEQETVIVNASSSLSGQFYEIALGAGPLAPVGVVTGGGQVFNVDPFVLSWFNGSTSPVFSPFANFSLPLSVSTPLVISAQLGITNPASIDGVTFSQPVELRVRAAASVAGPTQDDQSLSIAFGSLGGCSAQVPFAGTTYTDARIDSNGRLVFAGTTASDFSPTLAEALQVAFVGHWTDFNPAIGGAIAWTAAGGALSVSWTGVPYFAEPTTANDLSIGIDGMGTITLDVSGIAVNPVSNTSSAAGDAVFFGLSQGVGATDGGPTTFGVGAAGSNALPSDMVYDFIGSGAINAAGGRVPSVTALQAGSGQLLLIPGATPGSYTWIGS